MHLILRWLHIYMGSITCWVLKAGFRCTQGAFIFGILYSGGEKIGLGGEFWVFHQIFRSASLSAFR